MAELSQYLSFLVSISILKIYNGEIHNVECLKVIQLSTKSTSISIIQHIFTCTSSRCAKMMCNLDNILRDGTLFCEKSTTHKIVSKTTLF